MFHNSKAVVALAKEPNETAFQKTLGLNDFYFDGPDYDYPLGNIQMVGKSNAEAMKGEEPHLTLLAPHWSLADVAAHAVDFWLTTEDLPRPENRVTLDGRRQRAAGLHLDQRRGGRSVSTESSKKILNHCRHGVPPRAATRISTCRWTSRCAGVAHQAGTCRFGHDPATSVLDANCKAHEVDNLYVVDTSFFPSIGAVNPAPDRHGQRHPGRRAPHRAAGLSSAHRERNPTAPGRRRRWRLRRPARRPRCSPRSDVDITLIDRRNHHLFQPLLYQVATGILSPGEISPVLRHMLRRRKNVNVVLSKVTGFDLERRGRAHDLHPGRGLRVPLRQPDRRRRGRPVVLRSRRVRPDRPGHEDDRRRHGAPPPRLGALEIAENLTDPACSGSG